MPAPRYRQPERVAATMAAADDEAALRASLADKAIAVGAVSFVTDGVGKHDPDLRMQALRAVDPLWVRLMGSAREEVILQTPYLVLSDEARNGLAVARANGGGPKVLVSTSALASTDAPVVYALTHRFKREYVERLGFTIHELRPHAAGEDAIGPRRLLHSKALVVDGRIGLVGTHNFDGRSDHYNIEAMLIVEDAGFARRLADSIRTDMAPDQSWVLAPRRAGGSDGGAKTASARPMTAYQRRTDGGCAGEMAPQHADFHRCHLDVGAFPQTRPGTRWLTRILGAVGRGLVPIL